MPFWKRDREIEAHTDATRRAATTTAEQVLTLAREVHDEARRAVEEVLANIEREDSDERSELRGP